MEVCWRENAELVVMVESGDPTGQSSVFFSKSVGDVESAIGRTKGRGERRVNMKENRPKIEKVGKLGVFLVTLVQACLKGFEKGAKEEVFEVCARCVEILASVRGELSFKSDFAVENLSIKVSNTMLDKERFKEAEEVIRCCSEMLEGAGDDALQLRYANIYNLMRCFAEQNKFREVVDETERTGFANLLRKDSSSGSPYAKGMFKILYHRGGTFFDREGDAMTAFKMRATAVNFLLTADDKNTVKNMGDRVAAACNEYLRSEHADVSECLSLIENSLPRLEISDSAMMLELHFKVCKNTKDFERSVEFGLGVLERDRSPATVLILLVAVVNLTFSSKRNLDTKRMQRLCLALEVGENVVMSSPLKLLYSSLDGMKCGSDVEKTLSRCMSNILGFALKGPSEQLVEISLKLLEIYDREFAPSEIALQAYRALLDNASKRGDVEIATTLLEKCRIHKKANVQIWAQMSTMLYNLGAKLFNDEAFSDALPFLRACIDPDEEENGAKGRIPRHEKLKILSLCEERAGRHGDALRTICNVLEKSRGTFRALDLRIFFKAFAETFDDLEPEVLVPLKRILSDRETARSFFEQCPSVGVAKAFLQTFEEGHPKALKVEFLRMMWINGVRSGIDSQFELSEDLAEDWREQDDQNIVLWTKCVNALSNHEDRALLEILERFEPSEDLDVEDLVLIAEWSDFRGLHDVGLAAKASLTNFASKRDDVEETLFRIAEQQEEKFGRGMLARILYENSDELSPYLATTVAAKFWFYAETEHLKENSNSDNILDEMETGISTMNEGDPNRIFLQACLVFAKGWKLEEALSLALEALKARNSLPFDDSEIFSEWRHLKALCDCLALVAEIFVARGDPRSARFYIEQGRKLAKKARSPVLHNHICVLRWRTALLGRKFDQAAEAAEDMRTERSPTLAVDLVLFHAELNLNLKKLNVVAQKIEEARSSIAELEQSFNESVNADHELAAQHGFADIRETTTLETSCKPRLSRFLASSKVRLKILIARLRLEETFAEEALSIVRDALEEATASPHMIAEKTAIVTEMANILIGLNKLDDALEVLDDDQLSVFPIHRRQRLRTLAVAKLLKNGGQDESLETAFMVHCSNGLSMSLERQRLWRKKENRTLSPLHSLELNVEDGAEILANLGIPRQSCSYILAMCRHSPTSSLLVSILEEDGKVRNTRLALSCDQARLILEFDNLVQALEATTRGATTDSTATWDRTRKREWWNERKRIDQEMAEFMETIVREWGLLNVMDNEGEADTNYVKNLKVAELRKELSELGLPTKGLKKDLIGRLEAHYKNHSASRNHVVLVLSEDLQRIPWESSSLFTGSISRVPSIAFLHERIELAPKSMKNSRGSFIVDPRGDLPKTREALRPFMEKVHWEGSFGSKSRRSIEECLVNSDIFLFSGHGTGEELLPREKLAKLSGCASTLLMGCSSGKLVHEGEFDPSGVVLSYVLAGAPTVVANLWDVTDKDIDRFTLAVLEKWCSEEENLATAVQASREVCKLKFAVGAAPICIGIGNWNPT